MSEMAYGPGHWQNLEINLRIWLLALLALVACSACSRRDGLDLAGTWIGTAKFSESDWAQLTEGLTPEEKVKAKERNEHAQTLLEIKEDGGFVLDLMDVKGSGRWKVSGGKLTLTLPKPGAKQGSSIDEELVEMTISADRNSLTAPFKGSDTSVIVYRRK